MSDGLFDLDPTNCAECGRELVHGVCVWCSGARIPDSPKRRHHKPDIGGSKKGAHDVSFRAGTQKARLLIEYARHADLTGAEAATAAGISLASAYWMRCSELRDLKLIEEVKDEAGNTVLREGPMGSPQMVCRITADGMKAVTAMKENDARRPADNDRPAAGTYGPCPGCGKSVDLGYYYRCPRCNTELRSTAGHIHVWTWRDNGSVMVCKECGADNLGNEGQE